MHRGLFYALLFSLAAAAPLCAQDVLPPNFASWQSSEVRAITPRDLGSVAGDDAVALREYGFRAAEQRVYESAGRTLTITLYHMKDPTGAYGAFTLLRSAEMRPASWTQHASASTNRALLVAGDFLVDVASASAPAQRLELQALVEAIAPRADTAPFPPYAGYLPEQGLIRGSETYIRGPQVLRRVLPLADTDWVGFNNGAEVQTARYRRSGNEFTLVLIAYPTPQIAAEKYRELAKAFRVNGHGDPAHRALSVHRRSALLLLAVEPASPVIAEALLEDVRYATAVTWNEPTDFLKGPNIGTIVITSFVGIGALLGLALAFGVGFGGIRLIIKRFFPGKVFDPVDKVEILQLGISSKPIDAQDFYLPGSKRP